MDEVKSDEELSDFDDDEENEAVVIDEEDSESEDGSDFCIEVSDEEDEDEENGSMVPGFNDDDFEQAYKAVKKYTFT